MALSSSNIMSKGISKLPSLTIRRVRNLTYSQLNKAMSSSSIILSGINNLPSLSIKTPYGFFQSNGRRCLATVPSDPDTHNDFRPMNKLKDSEVSFMDIVKQDIMDNPVMIYMKGVPDQPLCGFSALAVRVLNQYNVSLSSRNILENPELKNAVKSFSKWPTFPQIFVKGEFIGGSDIVLSMHKSGELKEKLNDVAAAGIST